MIKKFCDGCGEEIDRNYISARLIKTCTLSENRFKVKVEVLVSQNGISNDGELCLACLMQIINEGEE